MQIATANKVLEKHSATFKHRFSILIFPYAICFVASLLVAASLRWLIETKLHFLNIDKVYLDLWGPVLISFGLFWGVLRKRILLIKSEQLTPFPFLALLAVLTMMPHTFLQDYVAKNSFDLVEIESVSNIERFGYEKYLKISNVQVKHQSYKVFVDYSVQGKYGQRLVMHIYFATPIISNNDIRAWYGHSFRKDIHNRLEDSEKKTIFEEYYRQSIAKFGSFKFDNAEYFELLKNSKLRQGLISAIDEPNQKHYILWPRDGSFEERITNKNFSGEIFWTLVFFLMSVTFMSLLKINRDEFNALTHDVQNNDNSPEFEPQLTKEIGRNASCPCGSGKKYKNCHLNL
jgi:uncharacterized protein YecA (UPF0149 family)